MDVPCNSGGMTAMLLETIKMQQEISAITWSWRWSRRRNINGTSFDRIVDVPEWGG
jgi:hypothetical protein